jgi:hypothetical protein
MKWFPKRGQASPKWGRLLNIVVVISLLVVAAYSHRRADEASRRLTAIEHEREELNKRWAEAALLEGRLGMVEERWELMYRNGVQQSAEIDMLAYKLNLLNVAIAEQLEALEEALRKRSGYNGMRSL